MKNQIRNLTATGIAVSAFLAGGGTPALATTYNWCPTASSGAIVCNNCTVNLTCNLSGFGITIRGRNVTLDGQGHNIWGYNPSTLAPAINDLGTGTIIKNVYAYYSFDGIVVSQEGSAPGAKTVQDAGAYGAQMYGIKVKGIEKPEAIPYAQSIHVRDTWSYSNGWSGFYQHGGNAQLGPNQAALGFFERITGYYNGHDGFIGLRTKVELANSTLSNNGGSGVRLANSYHGRIYGNTASYNEWQSGFVLDWNLDTWITQNYGRGNFYVDCESYSGAQWGVWNDFEVAWGPGCTN